MLNPAQVEALQALIGWALDEDHAAEPPGWIEEKTGVSPDELEQIAGVLRDAATPAGYLQAARALSENLPDSVPQSIETLEDARDFERELNDHARALYQAGLERSSLWLVPAPWDAPELECQVRPGQLADEPWAIPQQLRLLSEGEPGDPEPMLGRVMLATGALYARGAGTLSACLAQACVWERG